MNYRSLFFPQDAKLQAGRRSQGQVVSKSEIVKECRNPKCDRWDILHLAALARALLSLLVIMRFWENSALCGAYSWNFVIFGIISAP